MILVAAPASFNPISIDYFVFFPFQPRPRETNRFKVEINVAAQDKVTFNLTYQEVLERRLGVYEHVVYIDPGQPVEDLSIEVAIEENREITYLHVPPLMDELRTDVDLTGISPVGCLEDISLCLSLSLCVCLHVSL